MMIIADMFGVMFLWHIELNAISVVNIIMVGFENISKKNNLIISFDFSRLV